MATKEITPPVFPCNDIYQSAYLQLHGNTPQLSLQGGRVVFLHDATPALYSLLSKFSDSSETVPLSKFVSALKSLRGQMIAMRPAR